MSKCMTEHYRKLIARSALFDKVSLDGMAHLLESCPLQELQLGEVLLKPGQRSDKLYLILSGAFNIHLGGVHKPPFLTLGAGECMGEISVLTETTTTTSVVAEEISVLLVIKQSTLWSMTRVSHSLARNLLQILAQRLQQNNGIIAEATG